MARLIRTGFILILSALLGCSDQGQKKTPAPTALPSRASLNQRPLPPKQDGAFRFISFGHLYGEPGKKATKPSPSFTQAIAQLNELNPAFCVLLGDIFYKWDNNEIKKTLRQLTQLTFPVINAVGNHDVARRRKWEARFGLTYFGFDYGTSRFLVLDTELDSWNLSGDQLDFVKHEVSQCGRKDGPKSLFIFGHKVIWAGTQETAVCAAGSNDPTSLQVFIKRPRELPTFNRDVRPLLREASKKVPIYFFGGDVGAFPDRVHLFLQQDSKVEGSQLYYLACGIGNQRRDATLVIDVSSDGEVQIRGWEFATAQFLDLRDYGPKHWQSLIPKDSKVMRIVAPYLEK